MDVNLDGSKIQGGIEVTVDGQLSHRDANLRLSSLSTRMLQKLLPIQFPVRDCWRDARPSTVASIHCASTPM